jgi:hypothetical protein
VKKAIGWGVAGFLAPIAFGCSPAWALIICLVASAIPVIGG